MGINLSDRHPLDDNEGISIRLTGRNIIRQWPDDEIYPWLNENCQGEWRFYLGSIWFEKEEDAFAFKMRWAE